MADSTQHDTALPSPITPSKSVTPSVTGPPSPAPVQKFNSTPIARKLVGNPSSKKSLKHIHMDPALKEELADSELLDVPGLVEHLFPDSLFPIPIDVMEKAVYQKHWYKEIEIWKGFDPHSYAETSTGRRVPGSGETDLAKFLNAVGQTILTTARKTNRSFSPARRTWSSKSQKPLQGGPNAKRKPDVCLVEDSQDVTWSSTLVTLELKSNMADYANALVQLTNSAYMIFSTQDERRFFIGVSVCGPDVRVYVFDRSGVVGSTKFDFTVNTGLLVRLIAGLILTDMGGIGLDPSIRHSDDGSRYVTVDEVEYQIIKVLFISDSIRGRGTVCWHARREDLDYVVKDTWTDVSRIQTEAEILTAAGKTLDVAQLVCHEVVKMDGKEDSTASIRSIIAKLEKYPRKDWYENVEVRVHRRLVTTPVAEPLTHFKSKKELLQVLIGAIKAHRRLVEKHILHRDISINNVMIRRLPIAQQPESSSTSQTPAPEETINGDITDASADAIADSESSMSDDNEPEENKHVRGILIDLDYAMMTQDMDGNKFERTCDPSGHRTGTLPFMATEILMGLKPGQEHEPHHDLESFFYILLWIALHYAGPCDVERQDIDVETEDPIRGWLEAKSIQQMGINKYGSMINHENYFHLTVTSKCTLYFQDLVPCIKELRRKLFPAVPSDRAKVTHQDIIDILRKPLATLSDIDKWSRKDDEKGYGTGKRKLEDIQEEAEEEAEEEGQEDSPTRKRARTSVTEPRKKIVKIPTVGTRRSTRLESMPNPR